MTAAAARRPSVGESAGESSSNSALRSTADDNEVSHTDAEGELYRIGFLGFGTIARSIASGLLNNNNGGNDDDDNDYDDGGTKKKKSKSSPVVRTPVRITRRSHAVSSDFASSQPEGTVEVYETNAEVVDKSDVVFVCVLPQRVEEVVKGATWDEERHVLVSLASTTTLEELTEWSGLPEGRVFRMICLPRVAKADSVSLICPVPTPALGASTNCNGSHPVLSICRALGGYVPCSTQKDLRTLMAVTGLMGPLYGIMRRNVKWLAERGVPEDDAGKFVAGMYTSMAGDALDRSDCSNSVEGDGAGFLDDLIEEQTAGGLNEGALRYIEGEGVLDAYDEAMSRILTRLEGGSEANET